MHRSLLESVCTYNIPAIPYITIEQDIVEKLETALTTHKPLLILYESPFGQHQLSGFVSQIMPDEGWIQIKNGNLEKRIMINQVSLVVEWK